LASKAGAGAGALRARVKASWRPRCVIHRVEDGCLGGLVAEWLLGQPVEVDTSRSVFAR
jgi:hypothetical protein